MVGRRGIAGGQALKGREWSQFVSPRTSLARRLNATKLPTCSSSRPYSRTPDGADRPHAAEGREFVLALGTTGGAKLRRPAGDGYPQRLKPPWRLDPQESVQRPGDLVLRIADTKP